MSHPAAIEVFDPPGEPGSDYVLQIRVKNGPLLRAMRARGFTSARQLAKAAKIGEQRIGAYLALSIAPMNKRGEWKQSALGMACALHLPPECLFPEQHIERALAKSSGEVEISRAEIAALTEPNDSELPVNRELIAKALNALMLQLKPREERVLRLRFGMDGGEPMTLREIAKLFDRSVERIRSIESKALRYLQHPSRLSMLAAAGSPEAEISIANWRRQRDHEREQAVEMNRRWEAERVADTQERMEAAQADEARREKFRSLTAGELWPTPDEGFVAQMFGFVFMRETDFTTQLRGELVAEGWRIDGIRNGVVKLTPPPFVPSRSATP